MKIGILTGGGDCPGLNAAIRAVVKKGIREHDMEFLGIHDGWQGMIEAKATPLTEDDVSGILVKGGTILGSSRTNPLKIGDGIDKTISGFKKLKLNALIAIGGDDTLSVAAKMSREGLNVIGIPKTIDNDLLGTERTIGFSTAFNTVVDAIDKLHTTAESHHRVMVLEVMGRNAGWIAALGGIAGGADLILIPERPFDLDEVCAIIKRRHEQKSFSIVVVAEGAMPRGGTVTTKNEKKDAFGHECLGGVANWLKREIAGRTGFETRSSILGHIQRGGTPCAEDRLLATRLGCKAVHYAANNNFGVMVTLRNDRIESLPLDEAIKDRVVDDEWYDIAKTFFG
jgi:ATP-dependent phosphofructokinase / diphosphate-dependent phosphofructokinase